LPFPPPAAAASNAVLIFLTLSPNTVFLRKE
jgi:hypothetical protein